MTSVLFSCVPVPPHPKSFLLEANASKSLLSFLNRLLGLALRIQKKTLIKEQGLQEHPLSPNEWMKGEPGLCRHPQGQCEDSEQLWRESLKLCITAMN